MSTQTQLSSEFDPAALQSIHQQPQLTAVRERLLFNKLAAGDRDARQEIITHNSQYVVRLIDTEVRKRGAGHPRELGPYNAGGLEYTDIFQEGMVGLAKAVDAYDASRGVSFADFARKPVLNTIRRAISQLEDTIRLPQEVGKLERQIYKLEQARLQAGNKTVLSDQQLAAHFEVTLTAVQNARYAAKAGVSLNQPTEGGNELGEVIAQSVADQSTRSDESDVAITREAIEHAVVSLPERTRATAVKRFLENKSVEQTAAELGVSGQTVRHKELVARAQVKRLLKAAPLKEAAQAHASAAIAAHKGAAL